VKEVSVLLMAICNLKAWNELRVWEGHEGKKIDSSGFKKMMKKFF
jgi:hypothetical protein